MAAPGYGYVIKNFRKNDLRLDAGSIDSITGALGEALLQWSKTENS